MSLAEDLAKQNAEKRRIEQEQQEEARRKMEDEKRNPPAVEPVLMHPVIPAPIKLPENVDAKKVLENRKAEIELDCINAGFKNLKEREDKLKSSEETLRQAAGDFGVERQKLEHDKIKYGELEIKSQEIDNLVRESDEYVLNKRTEVNEYFDTKKQEADSLYDIALSKFTKEFKEKSTVLQSMEDSLQAKITLYNENVEPFCKLMAQDATMLGSYLQNYVAPILNNSMVKLLGTFSNLKGLRENALKVQARLNNDAVKLLMMANKIKRG
jgi:hypothetical protein